MAIKTNAKQIFQRFKKKQPNLIIQWCDKKSYLIERKLFVCISKHQTSQKKNPCQYASRGAELIWTQSIPRYLIHGHCSQYLMQVPIQRCSMIHPGRQEGVVTRTGKKHAPKQWHGQYSALRSASWASFPLQWVRVVNIVYFPGTQKATDSSL